MRHPSAHPAKFGTLLGMAPGGVPVFSSHYASADEGELPNRHAYRHYVDDVFMGYKWQCVELARRWLYSNKGTIFDDVAMAYEIFDLRSVRRVEDGASLPLRSFRNGSRRHPEPGSLLIWNEGGEFERTGHVAVVTEVLPDRVRIVEQNYDDQPWPEGRSYAREIAARVAFDGGYWLRCSYKDAAILGWVIQTGDDTYAEKVVDADPDLFSVQMREVEDHGQAQSSWLNEANPDEAAFVALMEGHKLADKEEDQYKFLCLSETAHEELCHATSELHALFMHATDWVMQDDARLARFNIPPALWPRIHQSWDERRNQMITGRFDFVVSEQGVKVYEYNCDSASCYMECGKVQGKWAAHFGCDVGACPGAHLFDDLVEAWKGSEVAGVVHLMHDQDPEEAYHALFMREALEGAGLETKTLIGVEGLSWAVDGTVVDPDGLPIRWVWKTWAWETALDQIREECEDDEKRLRDYVPGRPRDSPPRLVDVLLRKEVRVFEPLWTLIPSNKAILPVLWAMFPNHPNLLESHYELTEGLREGGYVVKPIAGRCGKNISVFDAGDQLLEQTGGRFEHQDQIYQALCPLPIVDGYNVQIHTFSVAGAHAGSGARVDASRVINWDSDLLPLRVLEDEEFLERVSLRNASTR